MEPARPTMVWLEGWSSRAAPKVGAVVQALVALRNRFVHIDQIRFRPEDGDIHATVLALFHTNVVLSGSHLLRIETVRAPRPDERRIVATSLRSVRTSPYSQGREIPAPVEDWLVEGTCALLTRRHTWLCVDPFIRSVGDEVWVLDELVSERGAFVLRGTEDRTTPLHLHDPWWTEWFGGTPTVDQAPVSSSKPVDAAATSALAQEVALPLVRQPVASEASGLVDATLIDEVPSVVGATPDGPVPQELPWLSPWDRAMAALGTVVGRRSSTLLGSAIAAAVVGLSACVGGMALLLLLRGSATVVGTEDTGTRSAGLDSRSAPHASTADSFWIPVPGVRGARIQRTEATVGQMIDCVRRGDCDWAWVDPERTPIEMRGLCLKTAATVDQRNQPLRCILPMYADRFCDALARLGGFRAGRLPTEHEWRTAADWHEGPPAHALAAAKGGRLNLCDGSYIRTRGVADTRWCTEAKAQSDDGYPYAAPVGAMPADRSPLGVVDIYGNLGEIVRAMDGRFRVLGRSFRTSLELGEDAILDSDLGPEETGAQFGVRCLAEE
jgi:hypothetical protein